MADTACDAFAAVAVIAMVDLGKNERRGGGGDDDDDGDDREHNHDDQNDSHHSYKNMTRAVYNCSKMQAHVDTATPIAPGLLHACAARPLPQRTRRRRRQQGQRWMCAEGVVVIVMHAGLWGAGAGRVRDA